MTDFHAHVLPGADHGSDGLETSLRQLELAEAAGIRTLIATPHYYPQSDDFRQFLRKRERTYSQLLANYHGPIRIIPGAEVHMCVGLDHLSDLKEACIAGTNVMLAELPFRSYPSGLTDTFSRMMDELDLDPILAHVDRYPSDRIDNLFSMGLRGQLNADGFIHFMGRRTYKNWIDDGCIVALGSDIHGTELGYSHYLKAVSKLGARFQLIEHRVRKLIRL